MSFKKTPKKQLLWDSEQCFQNQDEIFKNIFNDIENATSSIDMEMFIFDVDSIGTTFLEKLRIASLKGVKVKLVIDGLGSQGFDEKLIQSISNQNFQIKIYKPILGVLKKAISHLTSFKFKAAFYVLSQINKRNHRKLIVIDKSIAWVGSANISQKHSSWRETMVRVTGSSVNFINEGFEWIWSYVSGIRKKKLPELNSIICNTISRKYKRKAKKFRVGLINQAKKSIQLVNPYVIPPNSILLALLRAKKRGVEVSILTGEISDVFFVGWFSRSYYNILMKSGIKIYERKKSMIHSKVLIVDDKAILGSSNYNYRSLNLDLEIDIILQNPESISQLKEQWNEDIKSSLEIPKPPYSKITNKLIGLLDYLKTNS